jgi:hypothetical protein
VADSPDNLLSYLDQWAGKRSTGTGVLASYGRAAMRRGPDLRAQLRDQLSATRLPGPAAAAALYRTDVPAAKAYEPGEFTAGSFFRAAWHGTRDQVARKRLEQVSNSFGSEVPATVASWCRSRSVATWWRLRCLSG